jgi:hypothetical protein
MPISEEAHNATSLCSPHVIPQHLQQACDSADPTGQEYH